MSNKSCENCSASDVDIIDVAFNCPTVFGEIPVEIAVCKTCRSVTDFCLTTYIDTYEFLMKKIQGRRLQLSNKNKRDLK